MRLGIALPHYDFSYPDGRAASVGAVVDWAVRAESLGFDSVWLSDHFFLDLGRYGGPSRRFGSVEPLTTLGAIACATTRVRLGTLVLCYAFRHPAMLAKQAASLDAASGGRLDLGVGAGWYEEEFAATGIPFPPVGERVSALREYLVVLGEMLGGESVQKPRPPLWVGSKGGPRMLRTIAQHADGWNTVWRWAPDAYAALSRRLDETCESAGRDPGTVRRSVGLLCLVGEDEQDVASRWRGLQQWTPGGALDGASLKEFAADTLTGTPEQCAARIQEFTAIGVEEIIVSFASLPFAVHDGDQLEIFAHAIAPALR